MFDSPLIDINVNESENKICVVTKKGSIQFTIPGVSYEFAFLLGGLCFLFGVVIGVFVF